MVKGFLTPLQLVLIPSLRKALEWDNAHNYYTAFDIKQVKRELTLAKLELLSGEAYDQAIRSIKKLSKAQQEDWHQDFLRLKSWTLK